jgi:hypothetical protein
MACQPGPILILSANNKRSFGFARAVCSLNTCTRSPLSLNDLGRWSNAEVERDTGTSRMLKTTNWVGGLVALAIVGFAPAAQADVITGLYNTGVDDAGVALVGAQQDMHWSLSSPSPADVGYNTAYTSVATWPIGGPWVADTTTSRWITPTTNAGNSLDSTANGLYFYTLTFSLTPGETPSTASFSGLFAADDLVLGITLNKTSIFSNGGHYDLWTSFGASSGFVSGTNTLTFEVENIGLDHSNPTGLDVDFTASFVDPVPEPATWLTMILGFAAVGFLGYRRRTKAVAAA